MNRVEIVTARCSRSRALFGIRFEEFSRRTWKATWAFLVSDSVAEREGYADSQIEGSFGITAGYPGCPDCEQSSFVLCGCDHLGCASPTASVYACPWCGHEGPLGGGGQIERLRSGMDR